MPAAGTTESPQLSVNDALRIGSWGGGTQECLLERSGRSGNRKNCFRYRDSVDSPCWDSQGGTEVVLAVKTQRYLLPGRSRQGTTSLPLLLCI